MAHVEAYVPEGPGIVRGDQIWMLGEMQLTQ